MSKTLIITLASEDYIDTAKQLFSSVFFNSGIDADYMLLAYEVPEQSLKWFADKKIIIQRYSGHGMSFLQCKDRKIKIYFTKFNIFKKEFTRWDRIIFLDSDIIVRSSLKGLLKTEGFSAVLDLSYSKLKDYFVIPKHHLSMKDKKRLLNYSTYLRLKNNYDLQSDAFNSGVMVFETNMISDNIYDKLIGLANMYCNDWAIQGDQPILNLLFYEKWNPLPLAYNSNPHDLMTQWIYSPIRARAIILHFMGSDKPWRKFNFWHNEWKSNLKKAGKINLDYIPKPKEEWSKNQLLKNDKDLFLAHDRSYLIRFWWFIIFKLRKKLWDMVITVSCFKKGY